MPLFGLIPARKAPMQDLASTQPFVWGQGGERLTPEDIEYQRKQLEQERSAGLDFSPVQSWTQGAARVANALLANRDQGRLNKATAANAAHSEQILAAIRPPASGAQPTAASATPQSDNSATILAAIADPYIDAGTKEALKLQWQANQKQNAPNDTVNDYNFWKQTLPPEQFQQWIANKVNPPHFAVGPEGQMVMVGGYQPPAGAAPPSAPVGKLTPIPEGGAASQGAGTFPDPLSAPGTMTSGRRTVMGNAAVGGAPHSHHLDGDAADYVGATPAQLAAYFGPGAHILPESDHVHVDLPGYGRVPLFGRRGTQ